MNYLRGTIEKPSLGYPECADCYLIIYDSLENIKEFYKETF